MQNCNCEEVQECFWVEVREAMEEGCYTHGHTGGVCVLVLGGDGGH